MISIIVPAYNEEKYISKCLESVFGQEGVSEYEVIVVDNASTDKTSEIVKKKFPKANLFYEHQKGVTMARNRGAKEAKGEILIFFDADVIIPENYLKRITERFLKDKKLVSLSGPYAYDGKFYGRLATFLFYVILAFPAEIFFNRILNFASGSTAGNMAVKKYAFEKIGGFNENITFYGDDSDITVRLKNVGKVRFFFNFIVISSSRRLEKEGVLRSCLKYALNLVWPIFFHHPFNRNYKDIR